MGLRNGVIEASLLDPNGGQCPGGTDCLAYVRYWGESYGANTYARRWAFAKSPDGTNHHYQVRRSDYRTGNAADNQYWDVYIDFQLIGTTKNQGSSQIWNANAGGESNVPLSNAHAQTFEISGLQGLLSGSWTNWGGATEHVDHLCGSAACQTGAHPSNDPARWSWSINN